ncbi:hypothetical protein [Novosphingobium panipatense]|uniref:hypothetical protein n=1 Tax=Novosphingobium panipatense TaxID=428991 RepID=UPI003609A993
MSEYERDDSAFLRHESCPECGSRDNLARYASGRAHCFGCNYWEPADDAKAQAAPRKPRVFDPIEGEFRPIADAYGIDLPTCKALGIKIVSWSCKDPDGEPLPRKSCISFDYHNEKGSLWGQKIRYKISEEEKTYSFPHADGKPRCGSCIVGPKAAIRGPWSSSRARAMLPPTTSSPKANTPSFRYPQV